MADDKTTLHGLSLHYTPGERDYQQRIRGKKNYQHTEYGHAYNGYGGVENFTPSTLTLTGTTESGATISVPIKSDILDLFDRERLSVSFVSKLNDSLPDTIEVYADRSPGQVLPPESRETIFRAIHPRKKFHG